MAVIVDSVLSIISNVLKIYANSTDVDKKLIEWRLSDEAKQYYTKQQNTEFYKRLEDGDLSICDAIRVDKQNKIKELSGSKK